MNLVSKCPFLKLFLNSRKLYLIFSVFRVRLLSVQRKQSKYQTFNLYVLVMLNISTNTTVIFSIFCAKKLKKQEICSKILQKTHFLSLDQNAGWLFFSQKIELFSNYLLLVTLCVMEYCEKQLIRLHIYFTCQNCLHYLPYFIACFMPLKCHHLNLSPENLLFKDIFWVGLGLLFFEKNREQKPIMSNHKLIELIVLTKFL